MLLNILHMSADAILELTSSGVFVVGLRGETLCLQSLWLRKNTEIVF